MINFGEWGLGIGDWGLGPIPNPQSPIPNPQVRNENIIINHFSSNKGILYYLIFKIENSNQSWKTRELNTLA